MTPQTNAQHAHRALNYLDAYSAPILVKDVNLNYVWVNAAFERLFCVTRRDLIGKRDGEVFLQGQATQCASGDMRVLESGQSDVVTEFVVNPARGHREIVTRKERITMSDGANYLVGVLDDVTDEGATVIDADHEERQKPGDEILDNVPSSLFARSLPLQVLNNLIRGGKLKPMHERVAA